MVTAKELNAQVESVADQLRRRQIIGSWNVALQTAYTLRNVVNATRWSSVQVLLNDIKEVGSKLVAAQPRELTTSNMVRRILHIIRDEYRNIAFEEDEEGKDGSSDPINAAAQRRGPESSSIFNLLGDPKEVDYSKRVGGDVDMKALIMQSITELIDELETIYENISNLALDHIHSNEIIMTLGKSRTVENFLKTAAKKRKFTVIVAETAPTFKGQEMAVSLAKAGIEAICIPDSCIFALMSRVNKVIIGTHAVLANGGLLATSGSQVMASAAKHHATPVVVLTGLYKLSPQYPFDEDSLNDFVSPQNYLSFTEGDLIDKVEVSTPFFDYVKPELVNLYITNIGGHPPSYLYRLITENYDQEDVMEPLFDPMGKIGDTPMA